MGVHMKVYLDKGNKHVSSHLGSLLGFVAGNVTRRHLMKTFGSCSPRMRVSFWRIKLKQLFACGCKIPVYAVLKNFRLEYPFPS